MFSNLSIATESTKVDYPITDSKLPFNDYMAICRHLIETRRTDLNQAPEVVKKIIEANSPFSFMPENPIKQGDKVKHGALLIHGLYDCPFTMRDIGLRLQNNGILSRAILLPGHGTHPTDLLTISYHDWIQAVRYGVESLRKEVENIFLIGYSTGAALAVQHAFQDQNIAGIVLIAPAIKIHLFVSMGLTWHKLKTLGSRNKEWLHLEPEIDYVKYRSLTTNSTRQVIYLTEVINELSTTHHLQVPTFMMLSQDDETISAPKAIDFFSGLHNQDNRLLLYTSKDTHYLDPRIHLRPISHLHTNIKSYSHVCLPFAPTNTHYGIDGDFPPLATLDKNQDFRGAYNGAVERFYNLMYRIGLISKQRRKLTFNPDFDYFSEQIVKFVVG